MIANQVRRAAKVGVGAGGYLASCVAAYEFDDEFASVGGFELTLGSAITISGGDLHTSGANNTTDRATSDDTTEYATNGVPFSAEWYGVLNSGTANAALFNLLSGPHTASGYGMFATDISASYNKFFFGNAASEIHFDGPDGYSLATPYHLLLRYTTGVAAAGQELFINGVKYSGAAAGGFSSPSDYNGVGWILNTSQGEVDHRFFRMYNERISDAEAAQLFANRDIHP